MLTFSDSANKDFVTGSAIAFSYPEHVAVWKTIAACRSAEDVDLWKQNWFACANTKSAQFRVTKSIRLLKALA